MLLVIKSNGDHDDVQDSADLGLARTGRCLLSSGLEANCYITAISPDAISITITTPTKVDIGDWAVAYDSTFGRFRGPVVRQSGIVFDISLNLPKRKRKKLAKQLEWYFERDPSCRPDRRQQERIVPIKQLVLMRDGPRTQLVRIDDISSSGANISTTLPPPLGAKIAIGDVEATVLRSFEGGFACEFDTPYDLRRLGHNSRA